AVIAMAWLVWLTTNPILRRMTRLSSRSSRKAVVRSTEVGSGSVTIQVCDASRQELRASTVGSEPASTTTTSAERRRTSMRAPEQGVHAGKQFRELKRFTEIVVGTSLEAELLINGAIPGGQHEDRETDVAWIGTDALDHADPIESRHHHVQDDEVRQLFLDQF